MSIYKNLLRGLAQKLIPGRRRAAEEDNVMRLLQASLAAPVPETWEEYAARAADPMRKLSQGEITLEACYASLPSKPDFVAPEVPELIWDLVSDVDNPESGFREFLEHLENGSPQERVIEFIHWLG
jgi:hypothetical protein